MKLMTKTVAKSIPDIRSQDGLGMDAIVHAHYFNPGSDWFVLEYDGVDQFFGFVCLNQDWEMAELGYFSLKELENLNKVVNPLLKIERDMYWSKKTLTEAIGNRR